MRRIFISVFFILLAIVVNAQFYVGGTLNISYTKNTSEYERNIPNVSDRNTSNTTIYGLSPEIGYHISEIFAIGTSVELNKCIGSHGLKTTSYSVSPYIRTTFAKLGVVKLFTDAQYSFDYSRSNSEYSRGIHTSSISLRPGINVNISEKLSVFGKTTIFNYERDKSKDYSVKNTFLGLTNSLQIGLLYDI